MERQVAAEYRRVGRALVRDEIAAFLIPRRRVSIGLVLVLLVADSIIVDTRWAAMESLAWWQHLALPVAAFGAVLLIAGTWITISRRDRARRPKPTFLETGELDRVSDEAGRLTVTPDRAEFVFRLAEREEPRAVSRAITFGWVTGALLVLSAAGFLALGTDVSWSSVLTMIVIVFNSYLPFSVFPMAVGRLRTARDQADALLAEHP